MTVSPERRRLHMPVPERLPFPPDMWEMQIRKLVRYGFPEAHGLTVKQFIKNLPQMPETLPVGMPKFYFPLIVDVTDSVPYWRKIELLDSNNDRRVLKRFRDYDESLPKLGIRVVWVQDGRLYKNSSDEEAIKAIKKKGSPEVPLTLCESVDLCLISPYERFHIVSVAGSYAGSNPKKRLHAHISSTGIVDRHLHRFNRIIRNCGVATRWDPTSREQKAAA